MCSQTDCVLKIVDSASELRADMGHHQDKVLCHHCDLLVTLPPLDAGERATCPRCHTVLARKWADPRRLPVSYAISALLMLFISLLYPFVSLNVTGNFNQIDLKEIPHALMFEHYPSIALIFIVFVQLIPLFCMATIIILCLDVPLSKSIKRQLGRCLFILQPWCMAEIFLAGVLVSFVKLIAYGEIGIGLSFLPYCLFCLFQIKAFYSVDRRWLWQQIDRSPELNSVFETGEIGAKQGIRLCLCCLAILPSDQSTCPRCYTKGHVRRRDSLQWTMALLITSVLLYIPANLLPIMVTVALGDTFTSTIFSGVVSMWDDGSYPVAMIIFIASILIPCLKIVAIAWLCLYAKGVGKLDSDHMHVMYELVEFVGRWSMIDIFVIAVLTALVRMGNLMGVYPDIGAIFFALVVILTMISAAIYDPRLIWDRSPVSIEKETCSAGK